VGKPQSKPPAQPQQPAQPGQLDPTSLLNSIPSGGGAGTQDFIGLPVNTASPQQLQAVDEAAQSAWAQGQHAAAYGTGSQMMPIYQSWNHTDIDNLQRRMVAVGLLANTDYRAGVWDAPSQKAFEEVLGMANNMGSPWQDAMAQFETGTPMMWDSRTNSYVRAGPGTSRTNSRVTTQFTNPDDLATTANGVAQAKLGRSFTPDELQRFIRAYHDQEAGASAAQADAAGGGSYTQAPSADVAAATFAQQTDPTAYAAQKFLPYVQKMNDMLNTNPYNTTKPMQA
jgi:hypothetical protein